jgi:hypothetical protein
MALTGSPSNSWQGAAAFMVRRVFISLLKPSNLTRETQTLHGPPRKVSMTEV